MEGPSLYLAAEKLKPFIGKKVLSVNGNTHIGKERILNQKVKDIFSWGKHLVIQFEHFALRTHFMLYGSYEATIKNKQVSGDYPKKKTLVRLQLVFENGTINLYNCSLKFIESELAKNLYDFSVDTMSDNFDKKAALNTLKINQSEQISDMLLDQSSFAGVGNIIRNEVLFLAKKLPTNPISEISEKKLKEIIDITLSYVRQFYKWRKKFVLKKHFKVYRRSVCPVCKGKVSRKKTGKRGRISFFCSDCQH